MSESADRSRADEASHWFTVMTRPSVEPNDLRAFREWRRVPANAAAFSKVKQGWEAAGGLAESPWVRAATDAVLAKYPAKPVRLKTQRRFVLSPLILGLACLVILAGAAFIALRATGPAFSTGTGGQQVEMLADGTRVRLNTDTSIRVDYRGAERRVVLERGEAFFDVAHDPTRPFLVIADGARVKAVGTQFDVRRDARAVRIALVSGAVEVRSSEGALARLSPGQGVTVDQRGLSKPQTVDTAAVSSWTTGRVTFSGVPLKDAVAEMNRYSAQKIVLQAPEAVENELISGQFVTGDIEAFIAGASSLYGLEVRGRTPGEIHLSSR